MHHMPGHRYWLPPAVQAEQANATSPISPAEVLGTLRLLVSLASCVERFAEASLPAEVLGTLRGCNSCTSSPPRLLGHCRKDHVNLWT